MQPTNKNESSDVLRPLSVHRKIWLEERNSLNTTNMSSWTVSFFSAIAKRTSVCLYGGKTVLL